MGCMYTFICIIIYAVCTYSCVWQLQLSLGIGRGLVLGSPVDTKMLRPLMLKYNGIYIHTFSHALTHLWTTYTN